MCQGKYENGNINKMLLSRGNYGKRGVRIKTEGENYVLIYRQKTSVRQRPHEVLEESLVLHGYLDSGRTAFPDAHEPHGVKVTGGDLIPLLRRHRGESHRSLIIPAQLPQPHPGVDFVNNGMQRLCFHVFDFPISEMPWVNAACLPASKARLESRIP